MRAWIWMKFCELTGVGTWTNWSAFELDPDHSPDAGTRKSEIESRSNSHLTQSRLQVMGCTAERYCLLHVVVQVPGSFCGSLNFLVWRTVVELQGIKVAQFLDFGPFFFFGGTCAPPSSLLVLCLWLHMCAVFCDVLIDFIEQRLAELLIWCVWNTLQLLIWCM